MFDSIIIMQLLKWAQACRLYWTDMKRMLLRKQSKRRKNEKKMKRRKESRGWWKIAKFFLVEFHIYTVSKRRIYAVIDAISKSISILATLPFTFTHKRTRTHYFFFSFLYNYVCYWFQQLAITPNKYNDTSTLGLYE